MKSDEELDREANERLTAYNQSVRLGVALPPPPKRVRTWGRTGPIIALAGAVGIIIGSIMPWVSVHMVFGTITITGTEGDGKLTLGLGVLLALVALVGLMNPARQGTGLMVATVILAVLAGAAGIYDLSNVSSHVADISNEFAWASTGPGLYLVVVGAVAGVFGGFLKS